MRVQLDTGRKQVEIEAEAGSEKFLTLVKQALQALNYTEVDLLREWSSKTKEEDDL